MSNVATRLLSLILLLQSRPSWKAGELASELSISERTIHRYMGMLDEMGIPIYSERGPYGGFSLVRGYRLPPLLFTAEEATVLYMGANLVREVWGPTYGDAVTAVTAKLDNVLPDDLRQEVALAQQSLVVGGLTAMDYRPWAPIMSALRECIAERHGIRILYKGFTREETEREVDPYALTFQWGLWYLVGFCHMRQQMRTFRVDRIHKATRLERPFTIPSSFSVRDYLTRAMQSEQTYSVTVHVDASAAPEVRERQGHWMGIMDHDDGSITLQFRVANLDWTTGWVLSHGAAARVVQPPELVTRVKDAAAGALHRYDEAERQST
jgi:predicted DNA-binding transcriptional regulator YafY